MSKKKSIDLFKELAIEEGYRKAMKKIPASDRITQSQWRNSILARVRFDIHGRRDMTDREILDSVSERELRKHIRKELNTEEYTSAAERSRANLVQALKGEFPDEYKILRSKIGQFESMKNNLSWNKDYGGYVFMGRYLIDVSNSPKTVNIVEI